MRPDLHVHPWHDTRHHAADGGFQNLNSTARAASFVKAASWFASQALETKDNVPPPIHPIRADALHPPPEALRITWLGHASLLAQWPDRTVLTDPMLSRRASPLSFAGPERLADCPIRVRDLPPIDVVLLSHDHYDHLDRPTVEALRDHSDPLFLTPLGVADHLRRWGLGRAVAADWWQYAEVDGWRFHCTPAQHFSGRGLFDRNTTLWASWYVEPVSHPAAPRFFFGGDSAYANHFAAVREHLGTPDVAALPIGAVQPRWLMGPVHMSPKEAAQAFRDLGARHFIPIHWGTFDLAGEPVQWPAEQIRDHARTSGFTDRLHVLDIGESVEPCPVPD